MEINCSKIILKYVKYGLEFLGTYIKPFRLYIANQCLHRMKLKYEPIKNSLKLMDSRASRLGYLKTYKSYNIRYNLIMNNII